MFAWLAGLFFAIAAIAAGGDLHPGSQWLSWQALIAAGLLCRALHSAGIGPSWGRRP